MNYYDQIIRLHEHIAWLQDIVAKIQYTNLRRDMNLKTRTQEIDNLCKEKWKQK